MIRNFLNGYRECLVLLMVAKQNVLHDIGIDKPLYFTEDDAKAIRNWPWFRSVLTWLKIVNYVRKGKCSGLDSNVCPFCVCHKDNCHKCEYGANHIPCRSVCSHYKIIIDQLHERLVQSSHKLNQEFYRKVIHNIQKGNWPLY